MAAFFARLTDFVMIDRPMLAAMAQASQKWEMDHARTMVKGLKHG